jgi:hypothetical protein
MKTLQQIIDDFRIEADDTATPPLWSDATLAKYANEAQVEASRRARLIEDRTSEVCSIAVTSNTAVYAVDRRIILMRRLKLASQTERLPKADDRDVETAFPDWQTWSPSTPQTWIPYGSFQVALIPAPEFNDTIGLWVVREPLLRMRLPQTGLAVTGITRSGTTATVVLGTAPTHPIAVGDTVTISGAGQAEYNGAQVVTAVLSTTSFQFTVIVAAVTPATGTILAAISAVDSELAPRHADKLYHWMIFRALSQRDREEKYDAAGAQRALDEFEAEFGKRSSAIDETWIARRHGVDEYDGTF